LSCRPGCRALRRADHRPHQHRAAPGADAHAQLTQGQALGQAQLAVEVAHLAFERAGVAQQQAAQLGGLDAGAVSGQQGRADVGLERLDAARERRLGQVQGLGRAVEVAVLDQSGEVPAGV
jgi:hypothetical protein